MGNGRSRRQPGKADDVFASFDDLVPVPYVGVRAHLFGTAGARRAAPGPWTLPPADADHRRWTARAGVKVHRDDFELRGVSVVAACELRWPSCLAYAMTDLMLCDGRCNIETCVRLDEDRVHVSATAQVANWSRLVAARYGVDYLWPSSTASVSVKNGKCSVQFLKSMTARLKVSGELSYERNADACRGPLDARQFGVAAAFTYAGPSYLFSGKASAATPTDAVKVRLANYHHCTGRLQLGAVVELDASRPAPVSRLAFRVTSPDDSSVFRAAVGTDGIVNSLWEKRLFGRVALSLSMFVDHVNVDHGVGIGLSFG